MFCATVMPVSLAIPTYTMDNVIKGTATALDVCIFSSTVMLVYITKPVWIAKR